MVHAFEDALIAQAGEPTIDRLPRWEVGGQKSPRDPAAQNIEYRIHNLPRRPRPRPPDRTCQREEARNQSPFRIRQVGLVSVRNARMLRAGGWGPHGDLREVCKLPESRGLQSLNPFSKPPLSLIKIAARVVEMKTMIRVHLPTSCLAQDILRFALERKPRLVT
jgi:hypothetical protein